MNLHSKFTKEHIHILTDALFQLDSHKVKKVAISALKFGNTQSKVHALNYSMRLKDPKTRDLIRLDLRSREPAIRKCAHSALCNLSNYELIDFPEDGIFTALAKVNEEATNYYEFSPDDAVFLIS